MPKASVQLSIGVGLALALGAFQNCTTNLESPGQNSSLAVLQVDVNKKPATITAVGDAVFEFASNEPGATFECAIFGNPFGVCFSPIELKALADGPYTVEVRAVATDGRKSQPFKYDWRVDRSALSASITSSMPAFVNSRAAAITFTGSSTLGTLTGYECKVDAMDFQACASPLNLTGLTEGEHIVQVRSRESTGQVSQPAQISWRVDVTAPVIVITGGPAGDNYVPDYGQTASFTFTVQDAGGSQLQGTLCRLDNGQETACTTSASYQLNADSVGRTFSVRATDRAGNTTTMSRQFTYHYSPPYDGGGG